MDLPSEIVLAILKPLARSDLKSARLVSKIWSLCAAEFLFDVIYISPSKEDINVFEAITQHPVLSRCPRHLEYDGAEFLTSYSKDKFAAEMRSDYRFNETVLADEFGYESVDEIIDNGYRKYKDLANYQQDILQSGEFVEILARGLQNLVCLASVTLAPDWPFNYRRVSKEGHGSPLARSWSTLYPSPCGWSFNYDKNGRNHLDGARHYLVISSALARARKQVRMFKIGEIMLGTGGVPPYVFDRSDHSSTGRAITAFSGLEHFDMTLASYATHETPMLFKNMDGLRLLLDSMKLLKFLSLRLSFDYDLDPTLYRHENVFSATKFWGRLTTLKLEFMFTTATDLLLLLVFQMPQIRRLGLGGITLLEGTWHSVIEGLKQSNRHASCDISMSKQLVHRSGIIFMRYDSEFVDHVREYVMHGGQHPCIPPNQPNNAAQIYMVDIETSVRERLEEMDSTRSEELNSAARKELMDAKNAWWKLCTFDGSQASWEELVKQEGVNKRSNFLL